MKTAMQELWDVLNDAEQNGVHEIGTQNFKRYIEGIYLEKEKENIINSFNQGFREGETETMVGDTQKDVAEYDDAINYYNEKYKK